jgi:hypothetical protein
MMYEMAVYPVLFVALGLSCAYSVLRALYWRDAVTVRHMEFPHARMVGWALLAIISAVACIPVWEVFGR